MHRGSLGGTPDFEGHRHGVTRRSGARTGCQGRKHSVGGTDSVSGVQGARGADRVSGATTGYNGDRQDISGKHTRGYRQVVESI